MQEKKPNNSSKKDYVKLKQSFHSAETGTKRKLEKSEFATEIDVDFITRQEDEKSVQIIEDIYPELSKYKDVYTPMAANNIWVRCHELLVGRCSLTKIFDIVTAVMGIEEYQRFFKLLTMQVRNDLIEEYKNR